MSMYGIDISNCNGSFDISAHKDAQFVICKATDGVRFVDKTFSQNAKNAIACGKLFGLYHFANDPHRANSTMKAQAAYFVNAVRPYIGKAILVLDWEDSDAMYGGSVIKYGPSYAKQFLDEVYRLTGVRPLIYMSANVAQSYKWGFVAKDYRLWGAGYWSGATKTSPKTSKYTWGPWKTPAIHQYSTAGGLDRDIAYMTTAEWDTLCTPKKNIAFSTKPDEKEPAKPAATASTYKIGAYTLQNVTYGEHGEHVRFLQQLLNLHGYGLADDGICGPATLDALADYQAQHHLTACGKGTWAELLKSI